MNTDQFDDEHSVPRVEVKVVSNVVVHPACRRKTCVGSAPSSPNPAFAREPLEDDEEDLQLRRVYEERLRDAVASLYRVYSTPLKRSSRLLDVVTFAEMLVRHPERFHGA